MKIVCNLILDHSSDQIFLTQYKTEMRLLTALAAEARPLIRHYKLEPIQRPLCFPLYRNDKIFLVISGIGKVRAGAATAFLHVKSGELPDQPFLNVGIAGHHHAIKGETRIASRLIDQTTGQIWFPTQILSRSFKRTDIITVDKVEKKYAANAAYDMEASGFYPIACRASTAELVQILKIISDNPTEPVENINAKSVDSLIRNSIDTIDQLMTELQCQADVLTPSTKKYPGIEPFLERWHFSLTQRHRLRRLLDRWAVLEKDSEPIRCISSTCKNASQAMNALETLLNEKLLNLHL